MENNHMHSVIAFFVVFALAAMLAWVTGPAKPCRCISTNRKRMPPSEKYTPTQGNQIFIGGCISPKTHMLGGNYGGL